MADGMKFSASKLVKTSASQAVYYELRNMSIKATGRQLAGNKYAEKVARDEGIPTAAEERRGIIQLDDSTLFFCIDAVKDGSPVEIKMVDYDRATPKWYLESSLLQASFYAALLSKVEYLDTPKFRTKQGVPYSRTDVPTKQFQLWFGNDRYVVEPNHNLVDHYFEKAEVIAYCVGHADYAEAREFDEEFKHQEFGKFKINYGRIN